MSQTTPFILVDDQGHERPAVLDSAPSSSIVSVHTTPPSSPVSSDVMKLPDDDVLRLRDDDDVDLDGDVTVIAPEEPHMPAPPALPPVLCPLGLAQPVEPAQPAQPAQPEEPALPALPVLPEEPALPVAPEQPALPVLPEEPGLPVLPVPLATFDLFPEDPTPMKRGPSGAAFTPPPALKPITDPFFQPVDLNKSVLRPADLFPITDPFPQDVDRYTKVLRTADPVDAATPMDDLYRTAIVMASTAGGLTASDTPTIAAQQPTRGTASGRFVSGRPVRLPYLTSGWPDQPPELTASDVADLAPAAVVDMSGAPVCASFADVKLDDTESRRTVLGAQMLHLVTDTRQRTYFAFQSMASVSAHHTLTLRLAPGAVAARMVPFGDVLAFADSPAGRTGLGLNAKTIIKTCDHYWLNGERLTATFVGNRAVHVVGVEQDFAAPMGAGVLLPALADFQRPFMSMEVTKQISAYNPLAILHGVNFTNVDKPNTLLSVSHLGHGVVTPATGYSAVERKTNNFVFFDWGTKLDGDPVFRCQRHTGPLPAVEHFTFVRPLARATTPAATPKAFALPPVADPLFTPASAAAPQQQPQPQEKEKEQPPQQQAPPSKPEVPATAGAADALAELASTAARALTLCLNAGLQSLQQGTGRCFPCPMTGASLPPQ